MSTPILPSRCLALAFAATIILFEQSGIILAQTPGTTSTSPESKMDAKITQLHKTDIQVGTGTEAVTGKIAVVHYTGWLYEPASTDKKGRKFDSSLDQGSPFSFPLGGGRVIPGWDDGVAGMRVGGRRTLVIPPDLAYGSRGAGDVIPPDATLIFDIELVAVRDR
ncbi:MAG: FKBP-type peptidyl-prolyl cis-trans isomerase [Betaproteobacteria bacterium]|nr:MAG: FKBP-type peptidyl-prolyl cis-trans isomerase [Betaproteobacteria bacterium]